MWLTARGLPAPRAETTLDSVRPVRTTRMFFSWKIATSARTCSLSSSVS